MYVLYVSGLSSKDSVNKRTRFLMNLVRKMAQQNVFLMVCDRFDESILVLRRMLGLPSLSVAYDGLGYHPSGSTGVCDEREEVKEKELLLYFIQKQASPHTAQSNNSNSNYHQVGNETRTMQILDQLQPFDNALYFAANKLLDRYIAAFNISPTTTTAIKNTSNSTTTTTTITTTTTNTTFNSTTTATHPSVVIGKEDLDHVSPGNELRPSYSSFEVDLRLYQKLLEEAQFHCGARNASRYYYCYVYVKAY